MQSYQLDLSETFQNIHNKFHVSLPELYYIIQDCIPPPLLLIKVDNKDQAEIKEVLNNRRYYKKLCYLIKCVKYLVLNNK